MDFEDLLAKAAIGSFGIAALLFIADLFGVEVPSPVWFVMGGIIALAGSAIANETGRIAVLFFSGVIAVFAIAQSFIASVVFVIVCGGASAYLRYRNSGEPRSDEIREAATNGFQFAVAVLFAAWIAGQVLGRGGGGDCEVSRSGFSCLD